MDLEVWQPWTESRHPGFGGSKFQAPLGPVLQVFFCRWGLQAAGWAAPTLPNRAHWHISSQPKSGRQEPNPHAFIWNLANGHFLMGKKNGLINFQPKSFLDVFYFILTRVLLQQKTGVWERMWWYRTLFLTVSRLWQLFNCIFLCHEKIMS